MSDTIKAADLRAEHLHTSVAVLGSVSNFQRQGQDVGVHVGQILRATILSDVVCILFGPVEMASRVYVSRDADVIPADSTASRKPVTHFGG